MQDIKKDENLILEDIEENDEYDDYDDEYEEDEDYNEEDEEDEDYDDEYEEEIAIKNILSEEDLTIQDMADFLKIFGEYSRIKILESIMDIKYTVSDIACFTGLTPSAVCYHLKILKQAKIVVSERGGQYVYYVVSDKHVKEIYNITRTHIEEFQKSISAKEEYDEMEEIFNKELDKEFNLEK